jgi:hypothetical protein
LAAIPVLNVACGTDASISGWQDDRLRRFNENFRSKIDKILASQKNSDARFKKTFRDGSLADLCFLSALRISYFGNMHYALKSTTNPELNYLFFFRNSVAYIIF